MLPLRPVCGLLYSPAQLPTSKAVEPVSDTIGTGVRLHPHAATASVMASAIAILGYFIDAPPQDDCPMMLAGPQC